MIIWRFNYIKDGHKIAWLYSYEKDSTERFEMLKQRYNEKKEQLRKEYGITTKPYKVTKEVILNEYL